MLGEDIPAAATNLSGVLKRDAPEKIYLPHPNEWHPDHRASLPATQLAIRESGIAAPRLLGYEVWTPLAEYQHVEDITSVMPRKLRALRRHASQISSWDYVRAVRGLNEYRGVMAGRCRYAEVFSVIESATTK